jgi:hypothetical protein
LPALSNAKEQARLIKCMSNQKQIGLAFHMYMDDNNTRFPPIGTDGFTSFQYGGGDPDRTRLEAATMLAATNRPLWYYANNPDLFRCPADRGAEAWSAPSGKLQKTFFAAYGTSYKYNENPWCDLRPPFQLADPIMGLATKPESWVPDASRHVLLHCVAALPAQVNGISHLHVWHFPSSPVTTSDLQNLSKKTVAPVLFIAGHVQSFDFKEHFRQNPRYYAEPTAERIWYKAKQ